MAASALAELSDNAAIIAHLELRIEKLKRELHGQRSERSARLLCMCSPAGQEEYFMAVGVPVASRVSPPPKLDEAAQAALKAKAEGLASQYRTEFLHPPV